MASFSPFQNLCPQISKNLHKTHSRTLQSLSLRDIPQSPYPDPTEPGLPPRPEARNSLNTSCPMRPWPKRKLKPRRRRRWWRKRRSWRFRWRWLLVTGVGLRCRLRIRMLRATRTSRPINWYELFLSVLFKSLSKCFCDCTVMGSWKKLNLKAFSVVDMSKFETMLNCNKSFYCFSNKSLWIAQ